MIELDAIEVSRGMRSRDLIRMIEEDGWYLVRTRGSHRQFKHPTKPGLVTVPHPKNSIPAGTLNNIMKQAGLR